MYEYESIATLLINTLFWLVLGVASGFVIGSIVKHINER